MMSPVRPLPQTLPSGQTKLLSPPHMHEHASRTNDPEDLIGWVTLDGQAMRRVSICEIEAGNSL